MWDDVEEEEAPVPAPAEEQAPAAPEEGAAAAAPEEAEPPAPEAPVLGYEPKKLIFRHWIRPSSHLYRYNNNYRQNYYSDVISYLDRRNRGLPVEKPSPMTWGERALKTYLAETPRSAARASDERLLRHISTGARFQRYHSKSLISRKYSHLGFNIVSI